MGAKKAAKKGSTKKAGAKRPALGRAGAAGKAEGRGAVEAYIASLKPEHRARIGAMDTLISELIPDAIHAMKWSVPFYGRKGQGWIVGLASFKAHVAVTFMSPDLHGDDKRLTIPDDEPLNLKDLRSRIERAAKLAGWGKT